jgi:hypothetical protein
VSSLLGSSYEKTTKLPGTSDFVSTVEILDARIPNFMFKYTVEILDARILNFMLKYQPYKTLLAIYGSLGLLMYHG